jgi:hypothetical protein
MPLSWHNHSYSYYNWLFDDIYSAKLWRMRQKKPTMKSQKWLPLRYECYMLELPRDSREITVLWIKFWYIIRAEFSQVAMLYCTISMVVPWENNCYPELKASIPAGFPWDHHYRLINLSDLQMSRFNRQRVLSLQSSLTQCAESRIKNGRDTYAMLAKLLNDVKKASDS